MLDVDKKFSRWLRKLEDSNLIVIENKENIVIVNILNFIFIQINNLY